MKILVTGGTGYIGSHTVVELINKKYDVVIVDNLVNSRIGVIKRIELLTGILPKFYNVDCSNIYLMEEVFKNENIECIIHFAGLKSNAESIEKPGLYYENNLESTFTLLKLSKKYHVGYFIFSSSATVYGDASTMPVKESDDIGDVLSPYAMTKVLNEYLLKGYAEREKYMKIVALRYFNPIGAHPSGLIGQDSNEKYPNTLLPYLSKVADKDLPYLKVFGNKYKTKDGTGVRDYIHVVDLALGHIAALTFLKKTEKFYDTFNLGTGKGTTVLEFIKAFENANNVVIPYVIVENRPGDVAISYADVSKANSLLEWKAKFSIEDMARDSWNWQKNNPKGYEGE